MNWLAYNYAHDVKLPDSTGKAVPFLMYPQAEDGDERKDSLDPTTFRYTITSREAPADSRGYGSGSSGPRPGGTLGSAGYGIRCETAGGGTFEDGQ